MKNLLLTLFFFVGFWRPFGGFYQVAPVTYYYYAPVPVQTVYTVPAYVIPEVVEVQTVEQPTTQPAPETKQANPCPNGKCPLKVDLLNRSRL